ncbi:MAG: ribonuclease catalytic domain-containing protein [Thermodesulfobacteriota bacterium]
MKIIPKLNELVIYRKRREPALGILSSQAGLKLNIFSEDGKEQPFEFKKLVFCSGIIIPKNLGDREKKLNLRNLRKTLEENKNSIDIEALWEYALGDSKVDFDTLLEIHRAENDADNQNKLLLFWAVDKDNKYFERAEDNTYSVNSKDIVFEKKKSELLKKEKENKKSSALEWIKAVQSKDIPPCFIEDHKDFLELIANYAYDLDTYERANEAKSFIQDAGFKDIESAVEFLINVGFWNENDDNVSRRFVSYSEYSSSAKEELKTALGLKLDLSLFNNITRLETYSVDDETTEDIDDAISFEEKENELILGIHISDVSSIVKREDSLDIEAQKKGETVYFVEKTINMFPESLVKEKLSLIEGILKPSLSLFALFDKKNFTLIDYRFERTKIKLNKNLTYEQAGELFNTSRWQQIIPLTGSLREKRLKNGALIVQLPELKMRVDKTGRIIARKNYMISPPHRVVSECMVLMNRLAADFFDKNSIPSIFRSQDQKIDPEVWKLNPDDPLYATKVIKYLKPSRVVLTPEPHKSLGIDSYVQITSPIRRYLDLVLQRQLTSYISEDAYYYSGDELENLNSRVSLNVREIKNAQKSRHRYWLLKYLLQENIKIVKGYISQTSSYRITAYLPELFIELPLSNRGKRDFSIGEEVTLELKNIDPLRRKIQVSAV